MTTYKAVKNVTIGAGDIINSKKDAAGYGGNKFAIGDTAELTEKQAKQYAAFFKKNTTSATKEAKAQRNK
tara:strand:- start:2268 stop:2477 length:210 start_codon:yes stop_codon:yes gene_type:complete